MEHKCGKLSFEIFHSMNLCVSWAALTSGLEVRRCVRSWWIKGGRSSRCFCRWTVFSDLFFFFIWPWVLNDHFYYLLLRAGGMFCRCRNNLIGCFLWCYFDNCENRNTISFSIIFNIKRNTWHLDLDWGSLCCSSSSFPDAVSCLCQLSAYE